MSSLTDPGTRFKFIHMADVHLDAWREPELKELNTEAFEKAIGFAINENVDFVIIAGDLFHTSLPDIDILKRAVRGLRKLKEKNIRCYVVPGSHDFSQKEKTMLSVLEEMGLVVNVARAKIVENKLVPIFTHDEKINVSLCGMIGRKMGLEKDYFAALQKELELDVGRFHIFVFHSAISEYKPEHLKNMESISLSLFPKGFDYYAGGHVHEKMISEEKDYGIITYPGPLYPDNFQELERLKRGSFFVVEVENNKPIIRSIDLNLKEVVPIEIAVDNLSPEDVESLIIKEVEARELKDKILLLRVKGLLAKGTSSDINFRKINEIVSNKEVYVFKKDLSKLVSREFFEIKVDSRKSVKEIELELMEEHKGQIPVDFDEVSVMKALFEQLDTEKEERETNDKFNERVIMLADEIFSKVSKKTK